MTAIQILSDLHLEVIKSYDVFEIIPKAPYLALLGDIGNMTLHKDECLGFLIRQLQQFRAVLFVPGNHEAYHSNWPDTLAVLRTFEEHVRNDASLGEFVLLDRGVFRVPDSDLVILGCSLFSHVPLEFEQAVRMGLNDFHYIKDWDVKAHNEAHGRDLAWLNAQVAALEQEPNVKIAIFSHWSPSQDARAIEPRHVGSRISSAFSTDLSGEKCFTSGRVKVWASGHTHFNYDFMVERADSAGPLRLLTNQYGYCFAQAGGFDGGKTIN